MNRDEKIQEIAKRALLEIDFEEKKNYNTNEKTPTEMVKKVKEIINREVKKYDFQKNQAE